MATWHIEVEYTGKLNDDETDALGESVSSATLLATGKIELRYRVEAPADDLDAAFSAARAALSANTVVRQMHNAGTITGPHRLTVMDDVAHARTLSLVGIPEGAILLGISPTRLRQLRASDPAFPKPTMRIASSDAWDAADLLEYDRTRVRGAAGRPRRRAA